MEKQQLVKYQEKTYLLLEEKGEFVTICYGDYAHFGQNAITVKRNEVTFL